MALDSWKVDAAIKAAVLGGNAAAAGVIALCGELVAARQLSCEAARRVRDAMLVDVETAQAPARAKNVAIQALAALCEEHFDPAPPRARAMVRGEIRAEQA